LQHSSRATSYATRPREKNGELRQRELGTTVADYPRMPQRARLLRSLVRDTRGVVGTEYLVLVVISFVVAGAVLVLGYALAGRQQSSVNIVLSNSP
jgi:Flp pilus assembly pilin Flp